jgi:hypothetical protein
MRFFGSKITRNRLLPFVNGFSAAALTYRTNVVANGGTVSDNVLAILDTNFFKPLAASGALSKLDRFHFYAGVENDISWQRCELVFRF